jgi:hypothetical protein
MVEIRKPPECVSWRLLGEWWCVPIDITLQEIYIMAIRLETD